MTRSRLTSLMIAGVNLLFVFLHHGTVLNSSTSQRSLAAILTLVALGLIWFAEVLPAHQRQPGEPPYDWNLALNVNLGPNSYITLGWIVLLSVIPLVTTLTWLVRGSW
jgi:hypothetical protein